MPNSERQRLHFPVSTARGLAFPDPIAAFCDGQARKTSDATLGNQRDTQLPPSRINARQNFSVTPAVIVLTLYLGATSPVST